MGSADRDLPTRLIICVDGSQYSPSSGDIATSVHRIYSAINVGRCVDPIHGGSFRQEVKYVPGIGSADDAFSKDRIQASVLGSGYLKQIQEVYESCCKLSSERDEVWFFGFRYGCLPILYETNADRCAPAFIVGVPLLFEQSPVCCTITVRDGELQRITAFDFLSGHLLDILTKLLFPLQALSHPQETRTTSKSSRSY